MKHLTQSVALAATLCLTTSLAAQSVIKGVVVDQNKKPIIGANASLEHGLRHISGAVSDNNGVFSLRCNKSGTCGLRISYIGYEPYELRLNLRSNETLSLDTIVLKEASELLAGVEIIGRQRRDYNSDYSYSSTKIPVKNLNLAAAVSTVTKELIKDRQAFQVGEAIKGASSVQQIGFYNHFNIRGITQNAFGQVVNGMRTNQIYFAQPMTQNVERIEVIKGPSSISLSSADPGGTINLVTKKPLKDTRREVGLSLGSYNTIRGNLDFTGALNDSKTVLYRMNVGLQKAKSYRDLIENNGLLVSPSVSYIPNENTAINIELSYTESKGKLDRGQPTFGTTETKADLMRTPISMSMGAATDFYNTSEIIGTFSLTQKIAEGLRLNAQYMKQVWTEELREHRSNRRFVKLYDPALAAGKGVDVPNLVQLRYWERNQNWNTDAINAYLSYEWSLGTAKNSTILGYDLNYLKRPKGNGQYEARGVATNPDGSVAYEEYTNPVTKETIKIQKSLGGYFDLLGKNQELKVHKDQPIKPRALLVQDYATHSAYIQNLTKWGNFHLLLGLRHEWVVEKENADTENEKKATYNKLIPRVGLSYAINKEWSIYATYLQGFQSQSQAFDATPVLADNTSEASSLHLAPLESELLEAGVKTELFNGRLKGTISLFQIKQRNIPMKDLDDNIVLRGADRSRGIEFELAGYITPELQISAAYSYINAIITEDPAKTLIGARKEAAPKHNGSIWAKYSFAPSTALRGLTIGLGAQYSSDKLSWYQRNLVLPAYTVADAVVSYQPVGSQLEFALKVNNLFNTTYWTGALDKTWIFPGSPRNFMFNTTFRF